MRPRRCAGCPRARAGCTGSSTAPTASGSAASAMLPGERAIRSDCFSGNVLGVGGEAASVPERIDRPGPRDLGPARREVCRQSGTPASPSPRSNKAKAAFYGRCGTSKDSGSFPTRPRVAGGLSSSGVPRREIFFRIGTVIIEEYFITAAFVPDGVQALHESATLPGRDARTKSAPWPDRRS